jgi:hypothetical protein
MCVFLPDARDSLPGLMEKLVSSVPGLMEKLVLLDPSFLHDHMP